MRDIPFKEVTVMTRRAGVIKGITSVMGAAEFILREWPGNPSERLDLASIALVKAYDGEISPDIARTTFIEAAKEADIYIDLPGDL
ncbi:DUF982 domain-containing protein [Phyllobacterium ifriqiyense]|uniref:DUF982 domain-containing protein n=1 Tax=Phyllobacterium ifriqiyense TaxID=314238 RepID=UPI003390DB97